MFPKTQKISYSELSRKENDFTGTKEPLFDFEKKKIVTKDGNIVMCSGKVQIQQWIKLLLLTETEKYKVYQDTWFGMTDLYNLRGHQMLTSEYGISELKREIKEKIEKNKKIDEVKDINTYSEFNSLKIEITVVVDDEEIVSEVTINV